MVVYLVRNTVNGKIYVGKTVGSLSGRWSDHCCGCGGAPLLLRAIKKYGAAVFTVEELCRVKTLEELSAAEISHIAFHRSNNRLKGYNLTPGGEGIPQTLEVRAKISKAKRGKKLSVSALEANVKSHLGLKQSRETIEKRAKTIQKNGGYWRTETQRQEHSERMTRWWAERRKT